MFIIKACKGLARAQALGQKSLGLQALKSPGFWKALIGVESRPKDRNVLSSKPPSNQTYELRGFVISDFSVTAAVSEYKKNS